MAERQPMRRPQRPQRRGIRALSIVGELLITTGVLVFLFVGWYLWLNDVIIGNEQTQSTNALRQEWAEQLRAEPDTPEAPSPTGVVAQSPESAPVIREPTVMNEAVATLIVPRFGADYARTIAQGVDPAAVLNSRQTGIGHYPGTQMPGDVGNFAIAAHRNANGAPFGRLVDLRVGDHLYVETAEGWYQYTFRGLEYVLPAAVEVIAPVPHSPGVAPVERIMTLTTCNPLYSTAERAIAYTVMTGWFPREGGSPLETPPTEA
jgi:sortase A